MGVWGTGIYDNDDAADWSSEFPTHGMQAVADALDAVLDVEYIESPDGAAALAAADVVARLVSGRGEESVYCEEAAAWTDAHPGPPAPELIAKAVLAVERVRGDNSELAELWSEDSASVARWRASLADLVERLNS
jgi:hypothetical protein